MIHKEGYITILIVVLTLVIINVVYYHFFGQYKWPGYILQAGSVFLLVLVLQFFRNPTRNVVENEYVCLSPADGEVVAIEEVQEDEYFKDKRIQVSVFMSVWNVHSNRWPVSGTVSYFKYHEGKYLLAAHPKSSSENEHTSIVVKDKNGVEILFRQIAGFVARRIVAPVKEGDTTKQGQQFGFIKFGSRVDMFFPLGTKIRVLNGDKVYGGLDIIADMPKKSNE
jgi:phosphatidylserine decarboxylase